MKAVANKVSLAPFGCIRRANLTACPKPPEVLDGWLKPGCQSVDAQAEVLASRNFPDKKKGTNTVAFEDDAERVAALSGGLWCGRNEQPPSGQLSQCRRLG
jgi:hypothetical protein